MKPQIKPDIEPLLLSLAYLEHLSQQAPEFKRAIELLPLLNRYENVWAEITRLKETLEIAVKIPEYKFSNILSKEQYAELTINSIKDIQTRYLDASNNKLIESEKEYIIQGLSDFYQKNQFSIIPFYNQFRATKDDRIAYLGLTFLYFFTKMFQLLNLLQKKMEATTDKMEIGTEIASFNEKWGIEAGPSLNKEMEKVGTEITIEGIEMLKKYFHLSPEDHKELNNNQMFSGLDIIKIFEDDHNLDNKALATNYIRIIYKQVENILDKLTLHRKYIVTGYIALNFGIIKESEYQPAHTSYNSLTHFLRDRVKGILKNG